MYMSELTLELRRLVAVNDVYICYALKQGHIRVLHKQSAQRILLKAHTQPITDIRCEPQSQTWQNCCWKNRPEQAVCPCLPEGWKGHTMSCPDRC